MAALIEWDTVGTIFAQSLAAGIVIATAFACVARLLGRTAESSAGGSAESSDRTRQSGSGRPVALHYAAAAMCLLIVAAAVGYGVYFTIDK